MSQVGEYLQRIQALLDATPDPATFRKALRHQEWILIAAHDAATAAGVRSLIEAVRQQLNSHEATDKDVANSVQRLIQYWYAFGMPSSTSRAQAWTLAWWSSVAGLSTTLLALIIGDRGIIPIIQAALGPAPNNQPSLASTPNNTPESAGFIVPIALLHLGLIALFILFQFTRYGRPEPDGWPNTPVAKRAFKQLLFGWRMVWVSWLLMYSWLAFMHLFCTAEFQRTYGWSVADVLNIFSGFWFFYAFLVLDKPSVPSAREPLRAEPFRRYVVLLAVLGGLVAILTVLGESGKVGWLRTSGPLMGVFYAGLSMAFFFGRLDSHHMNVPRLALAPLYLYVLIQLVWVEFPKTPLFPPLLRDGCLGAALVLKVLLFIVITSWIRDGTFQQFLERAENDPPTRRQTVSAT